jgi:4-amino-4-deoxy-L-arabinose transferase-like glycosyltransferase
MPSRLELRWSSIWPVALLLLLSYPLILHQLDAYSLVNQDEDIYHSAATQMVKSGNWFHLDFRGKHLVYDTFMNAPIQYWARALVITIFGSSLWTMRILSALFGVAAVLMTYRLALFLDGRRTALLAGLIQLTTLQFIYLHSARTGELETAITFLFTLGAYLFVRAIESGRSFVAHHVCLFALMNLKIPVVIIPVLAELAFFALHRPARDRFAQWVLTGCVLLPFALSWHIVQLIRLWDPFWETMNAMAGAATGSKFRSEYSGISGRAWFYARTLTFGAFPWVMAYPLALFHVLRREGTPAERARWHILGLYALAVFTFYVAIGQHYSWYIIPAYPFLSIFMGSWLGDVSRRRPGWALMVAAGLMGALLLWADLEVMEFNPFWERAWSIPMPLGWRSIPGLGPMFGVPLTAASLTLGFLLLRSRVGARFPAYIAAILTLALLGSAALRVSFPLAYLDHQSPAARIRERLDAARAMDPPAPFPMTIRTGHRWDLAYYLWDDYEWTWVRAPEGRALRVFPRIESGERER